jgi:hypothetical protein
VATAGPAQRFPDNLIRISFPQIGGLVFLRVAQRWDGDVAPISPRALVSGLPWADFDLFAVIDGVRDPDGTPSDSVPIANPVTDNMLTKYRYWAQYPKVRADHNSTIPGFDTYVVDLANYVEVYNHIITGRVYILSNRDDALAYFRGPGLLPGQDPDLVGVGLFTNTGEPIVINPVPDANFWGAVATNGWTYHIEPAPPITIYRRDETAVVVLNLAKLVADMPLVSGHPPTQAVFTVDLPVKPTIAVGHGATLGWTLSASAWSPQLSDPVRVFERRSFPVTDEVATPVSGIPGAFTYQYYVPTFPHPQAVVSDTNVGTTARRATVTITFGVASVPPSVSISLANIPVGEG